MFGSVVLDVAIGMAFVYLLMSLIASVGQEIISSFLQLRPTNLLRGIRSLFSGDSLFGSDLADALYNHGLIRGLYSDPENDLKGVAVPALTWREKMVGALRSRLQAWVKLRCEKPLTSMTPQTLLPAYIPSRTFALAMIDILNAKNATGDEMMNSITQALAEHNWSYNDNKAGQAMYALALNAKGDLKAFHTSLENWYNDSMDRASGWYKRYTQKILLIIGLLLAVSFNVNSLHVAQTLWFDRDTRLAMVNAADEYAKNHKDAPPQPPGPGNASVDELRGKLQQSVDDFKGVTDSALLPVGWKETPGEYLYRGWNTVFPGKDPKTQKPIDRDWKLIRVTTWRCLGLMLGWGITGMAISLGAPFWFDTLNKFMVVRSTIKPQEKSPNEASKS